MVQLHNAQLSIIAHVIMDMRNYVIVKRFKLHNRVILMKDLDIRTSLYIMLYAYVFIIEGCLSSCIQNKEWDHQHPLHEEPSVPHHRHGNIPQEGVQPVHGQFQGIFHLTVAI